MHIMKTINLTKLVLSWHQRPIFNNVQGCFKSINCRATLAYTLTLSLLGLLAKIKVQYLFLAA